MANEIKATVTLALDNNDLKVSRSVSSLKVTQTTQGQASGAPTLSTVPVALDLGSVVSVGWAWMRNLDANETIQIGPVVDSALSFEPFIELLPGEMWSGRLAVAPFAKSLANTPKLDYLILEA